MIPSTPINGSPEKRRDGMVNRLKVSHFDAEIKPGQYASIRANFPEWSPHLRDYVSRIETGVRVNTATTVQQCSDSRKAMRLFLQNRR
jgi:hypothetical protein